MLEPVQYPEVTYTAKDIEAARAEERAACARLVRQFAVRMDDPQWAETIAQHIEVRKG